MDIDSSPLVSLTVFTFNQHDVVREAVDGALNQTYAPLEIIISDDCSSDGTYGVILAAVAEYRGAHTVRLNRNSVNMGLGAHVAKVHAMARGGVIVHAAGDDVCFPQRVERIMAEYLRQPSRSLLIESNALVIDDAGVSKGLYHSPREPGIYGSASPWGKVTAGGGATYALSRDLIDLFDPIPADFIAEDGLLNVRANLLSGVLYIPEPLMKYRVSDRGLWNGMNGQGLRSAVVVANELKWTGHRIKLCAQAVRDARKLGESGRLSRERMEFCLGDLDRVRVELLEWHSLVEGRFGRSMRALAWGLVHNQHIKRMRWVKMFLLRWFGVPLSLVRRVFGHGQ